MMNKRIELFFLGVALVAGSVRADRLQTVGVDVDVNWTNVNNWVNSGNQNVLPGESDEVRIGSGTVRLTTSVIVGNLKVGAMAAKGRLIIDGGSLVTMNLKDYNSAAYKSGGSIHVKNGGSALFNSTVFLVGWSNCPSGSLTIDQGTVRVSGFYCHNRFCSATNGLNTRTTINAGGLLDVNKLELSGGVVDVAGGTLIIRSASIDDVKQLVTDGRIIAMGGVDGWKIKVSLEDETGFVRVVAEEEAITLGSLTPVVRAHTGEMAKTNAAT
ncbi:MAG: hypothetical protein FJ220_07600 [Kiritimatiellaceae bacterium]|nr:hypothetical protein [Kiritimatiellaceae bacterium]